MFLSTVPSFSVSRVGSMLVSLWLSFCLTCCIAWPTQYRRSYQYFPPLMTEMGPPNQWDVAQEPVSYEQPEEDYYDNSQWADVEALSNLIEMYDQTPPIWGQIVRQKPEEEELYELKRSQASPSILGQKVRQQQQQPPPQKRQRPAIGRVVTTPSPSMSSSLSSLSPPSSSSLSPSSSSSAAAKVQPAQLNLFTSSSSGGLGSGGGQKEVALLRPPTKSRVHSPPSSSSSQTQSSSSAASITNGIDTGIISASERQKKPSAYDTLRKYLSLEDALKKEEQKRRVGGGGRPQQQKRSSNNFVAEEGSLIGQLSNLNKSMA